MTRAMNRYATWGRYLRVNLTTRSAVEREISMEAERTFLGGAGMGTFLLLQETPDFPVDPLGPDAPVVISFSPLVGSPLTTSAKFAVVSCSPLTGRLNEAVSSSRFAISGKRTGFDALVVVESADSWTHLLIDNGTVRFEDASTEVGLSAIQTEAAVRQRFGNDYDTLAVGFAGEKGIPFASVSHDGRHAGRGGTGAVFGSKRVKSISVRGLQVAEFAFPERLAAYAKELSQRSLGPETAKYRLLGTMSNLEAFDRLGTLPTRNFQQTRFEGVKQLRPASEPSSEQRLRKSCAACTIGCEHMIKGGAGNGKNPVRMEYESLYALGPLCAVADPEVVQEAVRLCDEFGLDTISTGGTIALAMECDERGWWPGDPLTFGDGEALLRSVRQIVSGEGNGPLLALGSRRMAAQIGGDAPRFAMHVKGLELPGYDPRSLQAMALGFAVGARGADHNRSGAYEVDYSGTTDRFNLREEDIARVIDAEDESALLDSLILCRFLRKALPDRQQAAADMLQLTTGRDYSAIDLRESARQIAHIRKYYNQLQGWTAAEDTLPPALLDQKISSGTRDDVCLSSEHLSRLILCYYQSRGWTAQGRLEPSDQQTLRVLLSGC